MIKKFSKSQLMFPFRWANQVVDWLCGLHSPTGTVKIKNTMSPGALSAAIDVDVKATYLAMIELINREFQRRDKFDETIRSMLDSGTMTFNDHVIGVNKQMLSNMIDDMVQNRLTQSSDGAVTVSDVQSMISEALENCLTDANLDDKLDERLEDYLKSEDARATYGNAIVSIRFDADNDRLSYSRANASQSSGNTKLEITWDSTNHQLKAVGDNTVDGNQETVNHEKVIFTATPLSEEQTDE